MATASPSKALTTALWIAQLLLAAAFVMAGGMKISAPIDELARNMAWVPRFSPGMVRFIGAAELLGGIGLVLPSVTRVLPWLTSVAALGLATVMVLAAGHHVMNAEAPFAIVNLVLGGVAGFIAWGRIKKAPIAPR